MLHYTRRSEVNSRTPYSSATNDSNIELDNNPILTYCNWNYKKRHHLTSNKLKSIMKKFDVSKLPFYVRIFNETPVSTIQYFIDNNDLSDKELRDIWSKVSETRGIKLKTRFWKEYNSLRALWVHTTTLKIKSNY